MVMESNVQVHKHTFGRWTLTNRTMDTGVLVVTEEEAFITATFIAAHGVDTHMLTTTVVEQTFVHI